MSIGRNVYALHGRNLEIVSHPQQGPVRKTNLVHSDASTAEGRWG